VELIVDYSLSCAQVFSKAALYMIFNKDDCDFNKFLDEVVGCEYSERLPNLPSWVPDWILCRSDRIVLFPFSFKDSATKPSNLSCVLLDDIPTRLMCTGWGISTISGVSDKLSYLSQSQDQVREAWRNLLKSSTFIHFLSALPNSFDELEKMDESDKMVAALSALLCNNWLDNIKAKMQDYKILAGCGEHIARTYWDRLGIFNAEAAQLICTGKLLDDKISLHPMALMGCLVFSAACGLEISPSCKTLEETQYKLIRSSQLLEGRRLGQLELGGHLGQPGRPLVYRGEEEVPRMGLFSTTVRDGDMVCVLHGSKRMLVCRPVPEEGDEHDRDAQHVIVVGECNPGDGLSLDLRNSYAYTGKDPPSTKFIIR
jgi:hypothetical protein